MANKEQLASQIRFALSELAARNAHHDFEHLCRHLARARIASNILPATGPVAGGGDQGRDFETFNSYLADQLPHSRGFAARVAKETLVFACTLQAKNLKQKVRDDVESICGQGTRVDRVYAFITSPVSTAIRHELTSEAARQYETALQFFDPFAIAEELAEPDLYWVAEQFLALPAELAPEYPPISNGLPVWYGESRRSWQEAPFVEAYSTYGWSDLRRALRYATFNDDAREDLPFWITHVRDLLTAVTASDGVIVMGTDHDDQEHPDVHPTPNVMAQRARYEIALASYRGTGDMRSVDNLVDEYLRCGFSAYSVIELQDAVVLLTYACGAHNLGASAIPAGTLVEFILAYEDRITDLVESEDELEMPTRLAALLAIRMRLHLLPAYLYNNSDDAGPPSPEIRAGIVRTAATNAAHIAAGERPEFPIETGVVNEVRNLTAGVDDWSRITALLSRARLFPLDDLSQLVNLLSPVLVEDDRYTELTAQLDSAVAERSGRAVAAIGIRDRATGLLRAGKTLLALRDLHQVKLNWWTGDSLYGALLCLLMISELYRRLGMMMAAKQYALAAAGAAPSTERDDVQELIPRGIFAAARAEYEAGGWAAAVELVAVGLLGHEVIGDDSYPSQVQDARWVVVQVLRAARAQVPSLYPPLLKCLGDFGPPSEFLADDAAESTWQDRTVAQWLELCDEGQIAYPFSDVGRERHIQFNALGVNVVMHGSNDYSNTRALERLAAAMQVALTEFANDDLVLLPTYIDILVVADPASGPRTPRDDRVKTQEIENGSAWRVVLAGCDDRGVFLSGSIDDHDVIDATLSRGQMKAVNVELLTVILIVLSKVSLLPDDEFNARFESACQRGLFHQLVAGRPYDNLAGLVDGENFAKLRRSKVASPFDRRESSVPVPPLAERIDAGPGYESVAAADVVAERYQSAMFLDVTLPQLRLDARFLKLVKKLREEGWLDWHILIAVFNVALNQRVDQEWLAQHAPAEIRAFAMSPESTQSGFELDMAGFNRVNMEMARELALVAGLHHFGLTCKQSRPDMLALRGVLERRYGWNTVDVEHEDPFPDAW